MIIYFWSISKPFSNIGLFILIRWTLKAKDFYTNLVNVVCTPVDVAEFGRQGKSPYDQSRLDSRSNTRE